MERNGGASQATRMQKGVKACAILFYWIAALSIADAWFAVTGGSFQSLAGLQATRAIAGLAGEGALLALPAAWLLGSMVGGVFAVLGELGRIGYSWAFKVGTMLYCGDVALCLAQSEWLSLAVHFLVLLGIMGSAGTYMGFVKRPTAA